MTDIRSSDRVGRAAGQTEILSAESADAPQPAALLLFPGTFAIFLTLFVLSKLLHKRFTVPRNRARAVVLELKEQKEVDDSRRLAALPTTVFVSSSSATEEAEKAECALCLSEYQDGESLRHLPCGHRYHLLCIDAWLLDRQRMKTRTCPLCKLNPLAPQTPPRSPAPDVAVMSVDIAVAV